MTTLPSNVYVVLAMNFPVVFIDENDAIDFASISGNEPVRTCALRTREDAAELLSEFDGEPDSRDPGYDIWLHRQAKP